LFKFEVIEERENERVRERGRVSRMEERKVARIADLKGLPCCSASRDSSRSPYRIPVNDAA